jgi:hypothetical protein
MTSRACLVCGKYFGTDYANTICSDCSFAAKNAVYGSSLFTPEILAEEDHRNKEISEKSDALLLEEGVIL